jgi:glycosyltransferase involved in cell wall biosynthesis
VRSGAGFARASEGAEVRSSNRMIDDRRADVAGPYTTPSTGSAMRIAVILPAQTEIWGGVQRFAQELTSALAQLAEISTYHVYPQRDRSRTVSAVLGMARLLSDHRRRSFDAVLTTFHWPPSVPGIPTCGVIHDLRGLEGGSRGHTQIQSLIARSWERVLVPSPHVADDVQVRLGTRSPPEIIGEGLDHLDRFRPGVPPSPRQVIAVLAGRSPHKRGRLGVDAAVLAAERLSAEVAVIGAVPGGCPTSVRLLSAPTDDELAAMYGSARVVVAPSEYEGFGLAAGEALRSGAPVVYALDGTLRSLVGPGGVGTTPTAESMAAGIIEAWARSGELADAGRRAVEHLTWEATAKRVLMVVSSAISRANASSPRHPPLVNRRQRTTGA